MPIGLPRPPVMPSLGRAKAIFPGLGLVAAPPPAGAGLSVFAAMSTGSEKPVAEIWSSPGIMVGSRNIREVPGTAFIEADKSRCAYCTIAGLPERVSFSALAVFISDAALKSSWRFASGGASPRGRKILK
jgi:hypothetical protein